MIYAAYNAWGDLIAEATSELGLRYLILEAGYHPDFVQIVRVDA